MAFDRSNNPTGKRLGDYRRAAGLSVAQAAEVTGLSYETIRSHEKGARGLKPSNAEKYARAYNVDASSLLFAVKPKSTESDVETLRSGLQTIADIQLPPDTPNAVVAVLSIVQGIARSTLTKAEQA